MEHPEQQKAAKLPDWLIEKAIKISCYQFVLASVSGSLVGAMFVTGFALKLHATNAQIGLMTTVPMYCVVLQLLSSALVERGLSRRLLTTYLVAAWSAIWILIALIPFVMVKAGSNAQIAALIALITVASAAGHLSANARSSWLADLIPSGRLGEFFSKSMLLSSVVGIVFSVLGGGFLDLVKRGDAVAFSMVFFAGAIIGLVSSMLYLPQPDVRLSKHEHSHNILKMMLTAFRNRPLVLVTAFAVVFSMQAIASPFVSVYILRDLQVSFLGLGIVTAVYSISVLISSTFWGRMVDTYGCRPVMIVCCLILTPLALGWIWITNATMAYYILTPMNLVAGFAAAGISVALSKILFGVTPDAGKSVQLAMHSISVYILTAPLPAVGGHMPDWFKSIGIHTDLRCTFYLSPIWMIASLLIARHIPEENAKKTALFMRNLPRHLTPTGLGGRNRK